MHRYGLFIFFACIACCWTVRGDDATSALTRLIRHVKTENIANVSQDDLSQIMVALQSYSPDDRNDLKEKLFAGMGAKRAEGLAAIMNTDDAALFMLMYYTRQGVADNVTDAGLHKLVGSDGQALIKRTVRNCFTSQPITADMYDSLSAYPPDIAAQYFTAVCNPWFVVGPKPYGAPANQETWASDSLFSVVYAIREAEWSRQSVIVRLLDYMGTISVPDSVDAQFEFSGRPDVTIQLAPARLSVDDLPALENLADDPNYGAAATAAIAVLESEQ